MPRDLAVAPSPGEPGLIGPNAVLQMLPVIEARLGVTATTAFLARAGVIVPDGGSMICEAQAARLHDALRARFGARSGGLAAQAGRHTGNYILTHRIPAPVQTMLRALPPAAAAALLSHAIARHAWTFAGSGRFRRLSSWQFALHDNPLIRGASSPIPLCRWHAAVFETLYRRLVHPGVRCREVACAATGDPACRFDLRVE
ncbi:bacteriochlorophyll 4-vinyl reductase [Thalassococcus sp. CAU 1522]|uniref:Bacteriochlorophyll 4-vinyl reductase n=1 Tax=Thalassococcus arenae TaxID=2851652 RepID=A0ABS6N6N7_9RHOB|nr:bacteriochlorophyll 4-vinyl reductase [Thalassococcus arenae]MBV2359669.1 bacteriochlorophyll 4-vinyl reductase [Thalassococcus arenae]